MAHKNHDRLGRSTGRLCARIRIPRCIEPCRHGLRELRYVSGARALWAICERCASTAVRFHIRALPDQLPDWRETFPTHDTLRRVNAPDDNGKRLHNRRLHPGAERSPARATRGHGDQNFFANNFSRTLLSVFRISATLSVQSFFPTLDVRFLSLTWRSACAKFSRHFGDAPPARCSSRRIAPRDTGSPPGRDGRKNDDREHARSQSHFAEKRASVDVLVLGPEAHFTLKGV